MNTISVIGTGYVGLVTGTCLSEFGLNVVCMDTDAAKIRDLEQGRVPIFEPGLPALIAKNVAAGRLRFTTDMAAAVSAAPVIFLAVPTPPGEDGSADLQHVLAAADAIARHMTEYKVIVNKSTVPIGTGRRVREVVRAGLDRRGAGLDFDVVSNPEFLREGSAIRDFMHPDRIVIGSDNAKSREILREIYNVLYLIDTPFIFTSLETAELVKYASNAFLATKIAFINEVANLCDAVRADVRDIARAMGMDGRIGKYFLHPGPGFGGSCFPKDTKALVKIGQEHGVSMSIVDSVVRANEFQRHRMVMKIEAGLAGLEGKVVGVLGLAFKQGTDDVRESSSIPIIRELAAGGAAVRVYDPQAMDNARKLALAGLDALTYCADEYDAAAGADALVILTEWNQFRHLDLARIARAMRGRRFFDLRNLYEPDEVAGSGLIYEGLGRLQA
ncbi:MAG TPA: UDP-glucose/GDP-mannose dehydrogenase family protein [Candidatus Aminicenantes bacterium]|nr:UDP-glucose/GDP-mannose dehydrogenase family protein [Candidatus Aminicenantes bacterium]HRY64899.1 UDP-glucose/GDP-mannose dehydrogenase family protein [Candidatus Aminicenantes bacterium]HRZ71812.1 UDP-glucose/GDP-mannose dehydrogenase family protein [Candidatus Aminicenantes bacterium]